MRKGRVGLLPGVERLRLEDVDASRKLLTDSSDCNHRRRWA